LSCLEFPEVNWLYAHVLPLIRLSPLSPGTVPHSRDDTKVVLSPFEMQPSFVRCSQI
jgi:hypothetical protein